MRNISIQIAKIAKLVRHLLDKLLIARNWDLWQQIARIDARLYWTCYRAGIALGRGQNPCTLLTWLEKEENPHPFSIYISVDRLPEYILDGIFVSTGVSPAQFPNLWQMLAEPIQKFSASFEKQGKGCWKDRTARLLMEKIILEKIVTVRPVTLNLTHAIRVDIQQPLQDLFLPVFIQQLHCTVELEGNKIGIIELPVIDGMISGRVLADAIASEFAWEILGHFFQQTVYPNLAILRENLCLGEGLVKGRNFWQQVHDQIGWTVFFHELWRLPDKSDRQQTETITSNRVTEDWLVVEVSDELTELEVSTNSLNVVVKVGGVGIGTVPIATTSGKITPEQLREALQQATGFELVCAAVREGILGRSLKEKLSLRERLIEAARKHSQSSSETTLDIPLEATAIVLGCRIEDAIGTSASRWASLPAAVAKELTHAAAISENLCLQVSGNEEKPTRVFYAPDLIVPRLSKRSLATFSPEKLTSVSASSYSTYTNQLPILMYHRITPANPANHDRWQLTPEAFEEQLHYLQENGFHSVTLEDWAEAMMARKALPGRPVLITFDDGYLDFFIYARPLLQQYGFSAMVFAIAELVGGDYNNFPLMGWQHLKQLQAEGFKIGSHSASHPYLCSLNYEQIVREAVRSRAILESNLGVQIKAFAYPFGNFNSIVKHLIGACGYSFGLSIGLVRSCFGDSLLELPRIEIESRDHLSRFISKLNR